MVLREIEHTFRLITSVYLIVLRLYTYLRLLHIAVIVDTVHAIIVEYAAELVHCLSGIVSGCSLGVLPFQPIAISIAEMVQLGFYLHLA